MTAMAPGLFIAYQGDTPVAYRYGEPWVAMQLLLEGGFDTPEEAKAAWEKEKMEETNED